MDCGEPAGVCAGGSSGMELSAEQLSSVHLLETVHEDVAATNLRERLEAGDACADVLEPGWRRTSGSMGFMVDAIAVF